MNKQSIRDRLMASTMICGVALAAFAAVPAYAQEAEEAAVEEVVVTGSRIVRPGLVSASPITSIGEQEIELQQQPEVEKIIRVMPVSAPADGQNVNNGTAGVSTISLRGLGAQRNLIMIDGKRVTPYDTDGQVDVSTIPTALIERVDLVTGGASAVYGSDAVSGAVNFILKDDFEGIEIDADQSITGESDGEIYSGSITMGSNMADGRGNAVISLNYSKREGVQLGQRPLGQLGIVTATGGGYSNYLNGQAPTPAPDGCGGPNSVVAGGSGTTLPTRVGIAGGAAIGQFRDDGSIGANCSVFNFNPYNYYQTPQERFGGTAIANYEINDHHEAYARFSFASTNVTQQVAPSGIFGSAMWVNLNNPLISASARSTIIDAFEDGRTALDEDGNPAPTVMTGGSFPNWVDTNGNGVVDNGDDVRMAISRRTVEFGPRSSSYDSNYFQFVTGLRGDLNDNWSYDVSFQHGESDRTSIAAGYTNVTNVQNALLSDDGVTCRNGDPTCVPINLFGGYGSITPEMAAYSSATALTKSSYRQTLATASVSGSIDQIQSPYADMPLAVSFGTEYREEFGDFVPDECWKLAPASCLGGAGGNVLPISGGFSVLEWFGEANLPLISDMPFAKSLDLDLGYRYSDYDPSGVNRTWKMGFNWQPVDDLLVRVMKQQAVRAPNVGELAAPRQTGLDNAVMDPCSVANAANLIGPGANATLIARCIATGMTSAQVGTVPDIVSGQINVIVGTDLANLPKPETADTFTAGFVWTPSFFDVLRNPVLTVDYYDINIEDFIGTYTPDEVLDGCYVLGQADQCASIQRLGGGLTLDGSGVETLTRNLNYMRAEGIEIGASFGVDFEDLGVDPKWGSLNFSWNANYYLTHEYKNHADLAVYECLGHFTRSSTCGNPLPEFRFVQRTIWTVGDFQFSYLWRHLGEVTTNDPANVFDAFEKIEAYDYVDLTASWQVTDQVLLRAGVTNVFEKELPVVGNEAGTTSANSGNTFPSLYDPLGRVWSFGLNLRF